MLNLGEFKSALRRAHKRGTALDEDLNGAIRRAAAWVEKNYTLQYMRRRFTLELESGDNEIEVPDVRIKAFLTPIIWDAGGEFIHCVKANFGDWDRSTPLAVPTSFYLDGMSKLIFNATYSGATALAGSGMMSRYSDFPIEDDETHWLLEFGESVMITQSMLELGIVNTRDERTYQMYLTHRQDQITVMLNADTETQYAGQDISL